MDAVAAKNAGNWLRLALHALTCPDGQACPLQDLCTVGKSVLKQICEATPDSQVSRPSASLRKLLLHWLGCENYEGCPLCADVWRELSAGAPATPAAAVAGPGVFASVSAGELSAMTPDLNSSLLPAQQDSELGARITRMLGSSPHEGGSGGVVDMEAEGEAAGGGGEGAPYAFMAARASTCSSSAATAAGGSATVGRAVDTSGGGVRPPQDPRAPHMQLQLKEATNYLRYLLHCLIVRSAMGSPHRQTGQSFWQEILQLPTAAAAIGGIRQQQQQQGTAAAVAAVSAPGAASSAAAVADAAAASGATQPAQRHSGGRRLLIHRLSCSSPGCVVCSKTCELFRRGLAVQAAHFPPPPPPQLLESGGLDALVEDLSRSIATIHL